MIVIQYNPRGYSLGGGGGRLLGGLRRREEITNAGEMTPSRKQNRDTKREEQVKGEMESSANGRKSIRQGTNKCRKEQKRI